MIEIMERFSKVSDAQIINSYSKDILSTYDKFLQTSKSTHHCVSIIFDELKLNSVEMVNVYQNKCTTIM